MTHAEASGGWAESSIDLLTDAVAGYPSRDAFYRAAVRHAHLDDRPAPLPAPVPTSRTADEVRLIVRDLTSRTPGLAPDLEGISEGAVYRDRWNDVEVVWRSGGRYHLVSWGTAV